LTGFYFRVLKTGQVTQGDEFVLQSSGRVCVAEANRVMNHDTHDVAAIKNLLLETALSPSWQATLNKRLSEKTTPEQTTP
jgi:MOSC domain-containing protein YiiM